MERLKFVDTHTMGEPTRIIIDGLPHLLGNTIMEKKKYLESNFDHIRTMAMNEPRGHRDMFGAIITSPIHEEADIGVIYMDGGGYLNMCGHGTMAVSTLLVEEKYVEVKEPFTYITLDTPAGLVKAKIKVENGKVLEVSFINVPSFVYKENLMVYMDKIGEVPVDIAFGGSFFAIVRAEDLGIQVNLDNIDNIMELGLRLRDKINREYKVNHPYKPEIDKVDLVEIYDKASNPMADYKNLVVFGNNQFDRSPCGTGTCAKMATLYNRGELKLGEEFVYESVTGTLFTGKILEETKIKDYNGIIPEITGRAFITGKGYLICNEEDPFKYGFIL